MNTYRLDSRLAAMLLEISVAHDFTAHKLVLKVRARRTELLKPMVAGSVGLTG